MLQANMNLFFKLLVQIFEVGDIAILADNDVGAKNLRKLTALYCGANAGFEVY
jgi:phenylalanyl-tRNA synthetase beta chain